MKSFLDEIFILEIKIAQYLYHNHAKTLPIIDYHCLLDSKMIAEDFQFDNLGKIWFIEDHYK